MTPRIALINPWGYDFEAPSFLSAPLGLLRVAEQLSLFDADLTFINCVDIPSARPPSGRVAHWRESVPKPASLSAVRLSYNRYGIRADDFSARLKSGGPYDAVMITCLLPWWYPGVLMAVELVRSFCEKVPVILGGIYPTLWPRHASESSGADLIFLGSSLEGLIFVLRTFGIRLRRKRNERIPWYRLGLFEGLAFTPIMAGYGCLSRYGHCAAPRRSKGLQSHTREEVIKELRDLSVAGIRAFAFYDDSLLHDTNGRDKALLSALAEARIKARLHCPTVIRTPFIDLELARLMRKTGFTTIRLGMERTGCAASTADLVRAIGLLRQAGFAKKGIAVELMYGVPEQSIDEVREGISFLKGLGVSIHLIGYSLAPNTGAWTNLVRKGVIPEDLDPLLTNSVAFWLLHSGYDPDAIEGFRREVMAHNAKHA